MRIYPLLVIYYVNVLKADVDEGYVRQMVQTIIDDLRGRQSHKSEIEERIEELEHRVTEQNNNYQVWGYFGSLVYYSMLDDCYYRL